MLVHFHWDAKMLVESFLDDPKAVRRAIGLHAKSRPPFLRYDLFGPNSASVINGTSSAYVEVDSEEAVQPSDPPAALFKSSSGDGEMECSICCCPMHPQDCFALQCEHWYCRNCWKAYIRTHTHDKEVAICCMANKCRSLVSSAMIDFLCEPDVVHGHQNNLLKYVDHRSFDSR
jgi:hypothetical protein